ncbi:glycosyltransferase [Streptomyces sp. NPDC057743]|uniref:glycosyltransferase n=1 Tax=Streptomyces sp. NPDC057743 TaxID=3346236 RepID=UPI0036C5F29C
MREVDLPPVQLEPYEEAFGPARSAELASVAERVGKRLAGRTVWQLNSTAAGGGVAELLYGLGPLAGALGVGTRWLVIDGDAEFFAITKRLCLRLYGIQGDSGALGPAELAHFRAVTEANAVELARRVRPGDVVVVHDPQPVGLVRVARECGASVVWRCHIGSDRPNRHTAEGWAFLRHFLEPEDRMVFSTPRHVPGWAKRPTVIPPSIDPCAPRNTALTDTTATTVLGAVGILANGGPLPVTVPVPVGEPVTVRRPVTAVREGDPPSAKVPMVVQVSRWDRLKDMGGVLRAFGEAQVANAYLTLAGPDVGGAVADDPEAAALFEECRQQWRELPDALRRRSQLLCLPMTDLRENALVVNALQRHATVVVQKSLAEGFGLTATEAMWKRRPLVASAVGGLRDQLDDDRHGLLLDDPRDIPAAAAAIRRLLTDPALAARLGAGARERVAERFLPDRHLTQWAQLIEDALKDTPGPAAGEPGPGQRRSSTEEH